MHNQAICPKDQVEVNIELDLKPEVYYLH